MLTTSSLFLGGSFPPAIFSWILVQCDPVHSYPTLPWPGIDCGGTSLRSESLPENLDLITEKRLVFLWLTEPRIGLQGSHFPPSSLGKRGSRLKLKEKHEPERRAVFWWFSNPQFHFTLKTHLLTTHSETPGHFIIKFLQYISPISAQVCLCYWKLEISDVLVFNNGLWVWQPLLYRLADF
jgi:hypothetical protein